MAGSRDRRAAQKITPARHPWRHLPFSLLPANEQMAWTDAMLADVPAPALRWSQIVPEALVLGHGQPLAAVDAAACRASGRLVYRRATGGTAVLAGPDLLNLDVVLPAGHPLALADVTRSYRWLGEALAEGLRDLGLPAETAAPEAARAESRSLPPGDPLRLACYALLSPYEVVAGGARKLVGLAQARRRGGALLQAGVLLRWRPQRLLPLLSLPRERRAALLAALRRRAAGLDELLPGAAPSAVADHLTAAIAAAAGAALRPDDWTEAERAAFAAASPRFAPLI